MGTEYRVKLPHKSAEQMDAVLRGLPCFAEFDEEWETYRYREEGDRGTMPAAEIKLEDGGIYLCDYGMSRQLFGRMVQKLISEFGRVEIEDYET